MMLGITTIYDEEEDVLRTFVGPPIEAATESVNNTILLRYEPESLKLVGIEILGARRLLSEGIEAPPKVIAGLRDLVLALDSHRQAAERVSESLVRDLRELIPP
jgi:hypothetical protein